MKDVARYECPEETCGLALRGDELISHLKWDHNRSERKAFELYERASVVSVE